ncbi:hypothetical protein [Clostridium sporogenes]|uniref:hypothetical protein n=1 Tax=Clostridium sporogenes TaxID=1509 RepID=UPI0006B260E0|nr:hypothetical protein [Clostridium sporogenes]KOY65497.1 hypothetical protein AN649_13570 [Clostridium sporogenes]MDS1006560.1 hypothetical protein [Clostridium sporogenes]
MKIENLKSKDIELIKGAMVENSVSVIATCQECKNVMPIDSFCKDMERANRLIYLINVINDVRNYNDMKFYEFNDCGYYALIGAMAEEEAINFYVETIADIENDERPIEITKDEAKEKLLKICKDEEKYKAMEEFAECINQDKPYLILMDTSLL